jgi:hypothetical protein
MMMFGRVSARADRGHAPSAARPVNAARRDIAGAVVTMLMDKLPLPGVPRRYSVAVWAVQGADHDIDFTSGHLWCEQRAVR